MPMNPKEMSRYLKKNKFKTSGVNPVGICEIMEYPAIFFSDGEFIGVEFPDLPGCFSQGKNLSEAEENAAKALKIFLEVHEVEPKASKGEDFTGTVKLIKPAEVADESHELMYCEESNRLVAFPKNQKLLGDKLVEKIKKAAELL